jgi:hypothetical protein
MNTSAHANQNYDITTSTTRSAQIGFVRRNIAGALLALAFASSGIGLAATAHADDGAPASGADVTAAAPVAATNCKTELWGFLGSQRRTLCDGPISRDGSWSRERTIWVPAHRSSDYCPSIGSDRYYRSCYGGYFVDQREISRETYPVRPETVLSDEPGHLD